MRMYDIIRRKRDGEELTDEEIGYFVREYTEGRIPDYQAAAFCMAVFYKGMSDRETAVLTMRMAESGDMLDLSRYGELSVDKHSTGGVGDKTSLIVGPIAASLGCKVTKMSGRGLGHTGGTIDKLESIPGFRTTLSAQEFFDVIDKTGMAIIGQSDNLTPADKKLYALRDVTATVDSIPLIVSSIMSKKLAAGSHTITLDVKVGSGAFMKTPEQAGILARKMVAIGKACGRNMAAVLTDMDKPLGHAVGNSLEVQEAASVLRSEETGDLSRLCTILAAEMVSLVRKISQKDAEKMVKEVIRSGKALEKMAEWISAQGGDSSFLYEPEKLPPAKYRLEALAKRDGYIGSMNAEEIGRASALLGAGRILMEDKIDPGAGIMLEKLTGDSVRKGDVTAVLYTSDKDRFETARKVLEQAVTVTDEKPASKPLIYETVR